MRHAQLWTVLAAVISCSVIGACSEDEALLLGADSSVATPTDSGRGDVTMASTGGAPSGGGAGTNGGASPGGATSMGGAAGADAGVDGSAGAAGADMDAATGAASDADDGGGPSDSPPLALDAVGTLVIVGDSISSAKASWAYTTLLHGDLDARYGDVEYHNVAVAGSETRDLMGQVSGLPASMPGPVVVCITSGGNDVKNRVSELLGGGFENIMADMTSNIDGALAELYSPDRFGTGVEAFVVEANVYDPTDGEGNFGDHGCGFGGGISGLPLDVFFILANERLDAAIAGRGANVLDLWSLFRFRGLNYDPTWFRDCQHPNEPGNDGLRRKFYEHITGEMLPP